MHGLRRNAWIALMGLEYFTATILSGCGSGSSAPPPPVISISFSGGGSQTIAQGQSATITANISNDPSGKGVTWKLTGPGTLSKQTSTSVEYDTPVSVVSTVTATVTATSVADPTKSASYTVTITPPPAISVSVSPDSVTVAANATQQFTATVQNDPANMGVTWTLSPASGAGTLSNMTSTSVTYNAPASPPASSLTVTITATSVTDASKSGSASVTVVQITVIVLPFSATVPAGSTQSFTATVNFDPSNSGVTWSISHTSGAGTLSDVTNTSITYNAPTSPPASNLTVTLTATSVADSSKTRSATITVPAISVSVSPGSTLMPVNATQQYTATVRNDPANKGVTWTLTQGGTSCSPGCGTVAPAATASGAPSTYTAPAALPANPAVTISATSVADTTKSRAATITITIGTVKLVPASLNFGIVKLGRASSMTTTLTNVGSTTLNITSITITGTNPGDFSQTNTCSTRVGAGTSCTITVTFKPTASGPRSANVFISDDSAGSPQQVSLSGGVSPASLAGSVSSALATNTIAASPSPTGPSDVGTRVVDLVDSTREDPFLADGTMRELLVRFWYPATLKQDCKPAEYTSPTVWSYFSQLVGVPLPEVKTNSCQDAPITSGAHPVVVFTPGYTGTFTDYTFLFEDLASRGYVVASVDHTYEATAVEFPDGRFVKSLFGSHLGSTLRTDEDAYTSAVTVRLSDLKFVLREIERLNATVKGPFAGKLDISRVALAGHSLGGLTALLGVEQEPRFRAGIILDGVAPDRLVNATETPMFMLITGREQWSNEECRLWSNLHGPRLAVNLPGAEHLTPSDAVWLAKGVIKTGALGPEKTIAAVRDYIAAFLDANLWGKPMNSLLAGPSPDYPDVVVITQNQLLSGEP